MQNPLDSLNKHAPHGNIFSKSVNAAPLKILVGAILTAGAIAAGFTIYFTPKYANSGYTPDQPAAFSHALHAGQLGLDCRYCHTFVDRSGTSNVPSSNTCWNCHSIVRRDDPALSPVKASVESGQPIRWVKVHRMPDFVYFNHAVHVNRGVSCVECHGQVNEMEVVGQEKPLSMSFCLDCHRNPEERVRPIEKVFDLNWKAASPAEQKETGAKCVRDWKINPPQSCSGCHR